MKPKTLVLDEGTPGYPTTRIYLDFNRPGTAPEVRAVDRLIDMGVLRHRDRLTRYKLTKLRKEHGL